MEQLAYVVPRMLRVTPQVDSVWYKQIMGEQQYPQNVDKNQMTCERVPQMDPMFWNLSGFSPSQQRSKTANALDFGFNDFFRPIIDPTFWALCHLLSGHSPAVGSLGNHFWGSQLSIWNSTLDFGVVSLFRFYTSFHYWKQGPNYHFWGNVGALYRRKPRRVMTAFKGCGAIRLGKVVCWYILVPYYDILRLYSSHKKRGVPKIGVPLAIIHF